METLSVSSLMNPKVKTVNEDKNIMSACRIMHENSIGCVIVVTMKGDGEPVGMITERDVVRILSKFNPGIIVGTRYDDSDHVTRANIIIKV